ncbi:hypothetical protein [Circular ssDNA virus sp.]|nr:hypothetical protein [Circular ssDNA virus sp.]
MCRGARACTRPPGGGFSSFVASDSFSQGGSRDSATLRLLTPGVAPASTFTSRFRFTSLRSLPTLRRPRYRRGPPPPSRGVEGAGMASGVPIFQ